MSLQAAMLCAKCKEVLNNRDCIFGTSCGHLYHSVCIGEIYDKSPNCTRCEAYKPCIYKMFLEFGETSLSWQDREEVIKLHDDLLKKDSHVCELERKYQNSQEIIKKFEVKVKTLRDALISNSSAMDDLKDRITTQEDLNKFLHKEIELLIKNQANNKIECDMSGHGGQSNRSLLEENDLETECKAKELGEYAPGVKKFLDLFQRLKKQDSKNNAAGNETVQMNLAAEAEINLNSKGENILNSDKNCTNTFSNKIPEYIDGDIINSNPVQSSEPTKGDSEVNREWSKTVIICNYRCKDLVKWSPKQSVCYLARKMGFNLKDDDINVVVIKSNMKTTATLILKFRSESLRNKFFTRKYCLKRFENTKFLEISKN